MKVAHKVTYLFLVLTALAGCKVFDNEVIAPGYICIPSFTFETDNLPGDLVKNQGDSMNGFVDAWIYSNDNLEGTFGFPVKGGLDFARVIPIQHNGPTKISIDAGILRTGQSNERRPASFITRYNVNVNLKPGQVDTIRPVFRYGASCRFLLIEDFDQDAGILLTKKISQPGDSIIREGGSQARTPGKLSGRLKVQPNTSEYPAELLIGTLNNFEYRRGQQVYLELDYKTNIPLHVGVNVIDVDGNSVLVPIFLTNATGTWTRVYVDLSEELSVRGTGVRFWPYFRFYTQPGQTPPDVMLDNIKLIQF
jgi:hypothetical protein